MEPSSHGLERIAKAQSRNQILLIILCTAVAACAAATWRAGSAMREANELQKQLLAQPAAAATKQPRKRQLSAGAKKSSAQSQLSTRPGERRRTNSEQATDDKAPPADVAGTRTAMARSGRQ